MRVLIDTNIIIDAITGREPWNATAEKIYNKDFEYIINESIYW